MKRIIFFEGGWMNEKSKINEKCIYKLLLLQMYGCNHTQHERQHIQILTIEIPPSPLPRDLAISLWEYQEDIISKYTEHVLNALINSISSSDMTSMLGYTLREEVSKSFNGKF